MHAERKRCVKTNCRSWVKPDEGRIPPDGKCWACWLWDGIMPREWKRNRHYGYGPVWPAIQPED